VARRQLTHRLAAALALAGLVVAVYALVILAFGRPPRGDERTLVALSAAAAAVCALLWVPIRAWLLVGRAGGERAAPEDALRTFGRRLIAAQPYDDLLLTLAETLRRTLALEAAEVWTGAGGVLERAVSDPDRGPAGLVLTPAEQSVVAKAGIAGQTWARIWLAGLIEGREGAELRVAPVTSAGELLGVILVQRPAGAEPFEPSDERVLAELARQLGLALRNVRLDSALQASLAELRRQAEELRASRARVVTAADAERRRIERDLHDGAQQHLVGLVVNLRLARELADADPAEAKALLESLGHDAKQAFEELRELAHGIYPPLLLDRGLDEALRAVASRATIGARVEASAIGRYPPQVEATIYFCCVEALQNAAKHAGPAARATVHIVEEEGVLRFEVADDGAGFDSRSARRGAGLTSMGDRLGALGGRLTVSAQPDHGTRVSGTIPLAP
jgi:signal transduction histidine kinase